MGRGKYSLVEEIAERLPAGRVLLEPFVGAGSVFLNTDYDAYVLNDINPDLICLYNHLKLTPDSFIAEARKLFVAEHNHKAAYYRLRTQFNQTETTFERALLFLFLNRHGFNGLCRYNKKGGFNVPFGSYKKPYFPEKSCGPLPKRRRRRPLSARATPMPSSVPKRIGLSIAILPMRRSPLRRASPPMPPAGLPWMIRRSWRDWPVTQPLTKGCQC